ncbi:MAG: sulfite exporter TauE/SafE family protein [Bryobacteraceae bacterium]|nr:sulfite exporter TauE/SafE family protein [Bryobacteraceae bacterium]
MEIFLPVAGISINIFAVSGAGALVGFLSGLLGVGGGFLLMPILMLLGVPPTVAAASDTCAIVATSSSGMAAHFRMGNVDHRMGALLLLGGLSGAWVGVRLIKELRAAGTADLFITLTYIVVLAGVGTYMFVEGLHSLRRGSLVPRAATTVRPVGVFGKLPLQINFPQSGIQASIFAPYLLCGIKGLLAAIMGVGGGFIMVPMMVYILRMPMRVVVGTDLFQILFTCTGMTIMHAVTNNTVDLVLALLVAAGSTIGAQLGARVNRYLNGDHLKIILASIVLIVTIQMAVGLTLTPATLLAHPAKTH